MLSNALIAELISCNKNVVKPEKQKMLLDNRHYKNNIILSSLDGKYKFKMFLRKSDVFIEDFSVGLIWTNPNEYIEVNKNIILLRCQGPHDSKSPLSSDIHHSYHMHEITIEDIKENRYLKPSNKETTDKFNSFEEACYYFVRHCGIIGIDIDKLMKISSSSNEIDGQYSFF